MKKISREIKIGLSFVIALFILYFGINFLKGFNLFKSSNSYVVVFDNVEGLTQSTPVTLNGFQVGIVNMMELDPHNRGRVITHINLDKGVNMPKGSKVSLDVSVLGNATISLELNPYTEEIASTHDTIIGFRKKGLMDAAGSFVPQVEQLLPKIDSILIGIQRIVNNPALDQSLTNVGEITDELTETTKQLTTMTAAINKDIPVITTNLKNMSNDLSMTSKQISSLDIVSTYSSIDSTLKNFHELSVKLNSRDNSIGFLLNDDRQIYDSLSNAVDNMSFLLKDVKENPKKYINIKVF